MYGIIFGIIIGYFLNSNICEIIQKKHEKWKRLNNLVSSKYKSNLMINWISFCMFVETKYIDILQYLNKTLCKIDKNTYEITYKVNGRIYKMIVKPNRGPGIVDKIFNENNEDITEKIVPYLGPNNNWHNNIFYVDFFDYEKLTFEVCNGEIKEFVRYEKIIIFQIIDMEK